MPIEFESMAIQWLKFIMIILGLWMYSVSSVRSVKRRNLARTIDPLIEGPALSIVLVSCLFSCLYE